MAFLLLTACAQGRLVELCQIGEDKILVSDGVIFAFCLLVAFCGFGFYELLAHSYVRVSIDYRRHDPP